MAYTVASDSFVVGEFGSVLTDDELGGCNIPAAIAAGHLVLTDDVPPEDPDKSTAKSATTTKEK
jgi:hypothetical protein